VKPHIDYLEHVRSEGLAFADAAARDQTARVPSCPDWNVAELVNHLGNVYGTVTMRVELGLDEYREREPENPDITGDELIGWFHDKLQRLWNALGAASPDAPAWSWAPDHTVGFWRRRMAHETAVHRWDAQLATGSPEPIERLLAVDGVDEMLDVHLMESDQPYEGTEGLVELAATDGDETWLLALEKGRPVRRARDGVPSVTARGPASDLMLCLWERVGTDVVQVSGDETAFRDLFRWGEE
jgi:uncharacterized protein (TIGR03083 family)